MSQESEQYTFTIPEGLAKYLPDDVRERANSDSSIMQYIESCISSFIGDGTESVARGSYLIDGICKRLSAVHNQEMLATLVYSGVPRTAHQSGNASNTEAHTSRAEHEEANSLSDEESRADTEEGQLTNSSALRDNSNSGAKAAKVTTGSRDRSSSVYVSRHNHNQDGEIDPDDAVVELPLRRSPRKTVDIPRPIQSTARTPVLETDQSTTLVRKRKSADTTRTGKLSSTQGKRRRDDVLITNNKAIAQEEQASDAGLKDKEATTANEVDEDGADGEDVDGEGSDKTLACIARARDMIVDTAYTAAGLDRLKDLLVQSQPTDLNSDNATVADPNLPPLMARFTVATKQYHLANMHSTWSNIQTYYAHISLSEAHSQLIAAISDDADCEDAKFIRQYASSKNLVLRQGVGMATLAWRWILDQFYGAAALGYKTKAYTAKKAQAAAHVREGQFLGAIQKHLGDSMFFLMEPSTARQCAKFIKLADFSCLVQDIATTCPAFLKVNKLIADQLKCDGQDRITELNDGDEDQAVEASENPLMAQVLDIFHSVDAQTLASSSQRFLDIKSKADMLFCSQTYSAE